MMDYKEMTEIVTRGIPDIPERSVVFINLVDTDTLYGHRRDPAGYGREIMRISRYLEGFCGLMRNTDVLYFTADHGCDPGFSGTDHTREYVPLLVFDKSLVNDDGPVEAPEADARCLGISEGFNWCVKDIIRREKECASNGTVYSLKSVQNEKERQYLRIFLSEEFGSPHFQPEQPVS